MNLRKSKITVNFIAARIIFALMATLMINSIAGAQLITDDSTAHSITLNWTAPGDDGNNGTAFEYDIRYSTSLISEGNWDVASQAINEPTPSAAGSAESFIVDNLQPATTYYFAIKTLDDASNCSGLSNVVSRSTGSDTDTEPPSDISNFLASNPSLSSIAFAWTAPGDDGNSGTASQYDIRYSTANITEANFNSATQATGEPTPQVAGSAESFTVAGLQSGTTYYFAIKTRDDASNWSGISNITNATTQVGNLPPSDVENLVAANPTTSSVTLVWSAPGADGDQGTVTQYDVRYSTVNIDDNSFVQATQIHNEPAPQPAGTEQSVTINGLSENTSYYFALKAVDEVDQWSGLSNIPSITTQGGQDITAPGTVANFAVESIDDNSADLSWTAPGDDGFVGQASVYDIRYNTVAITNTNWGQCTPVNNEPTPQVAGSVETFTITGLAEGTTYYFAMKAYDEVPNYGLLSNNASGTTGSETTAPVAITSLEVSQANEHDVELSWIAPGDDDDQGQASQYDIRYSLSPITIANWGAAAQVSNEPAPQVAGSAESFTVEGLDAEVRYYFAIRTADEVPNWSTLSNVANVITPDQTAPAAIIDLSAATGYDIGSVSIEWTAPGDDENDGIAQSYVIKYSSSPINEANWNAAIAVNDPPAPIQSGSQQNFDIGGLNPGQIYYVAMKAQDNYSNIADISNLVSAEARPFVLDDIDDINGLPRDFNLSQNYPNPFNPTTNIDFALPAPSHVSLNVYDSNGRLVSNLADHYFEAGYHSIVWKGESDSGRNVSTGVYFYHLVANNFESTKKMIFLK